MFDKQIESKEEMDRIKQGLESHEIVQKTMKDQISILNNKFNVLMKDISKDLDTKLISLNDNISMSTG